MNQDSSNHLRSAGVTRCLLLVLFLLLGFLALTRLLSIYLDFSSPVELTYPTSVMIYHARDFQHGRPIYLDFRQQPHVLALYGPLAYVVPGSLGRWVRADERGLFRIGRSLSLVYTAGSLLVIGALLQRRERAGWTVTCLMLLIFGTADILWPVSMCPRPDAAETFFVLLGLAAFLFLEPSPWRYAAVAPLAIAFLFKQSAVVGPIAIILYLLFQKRSGQALAFTLASLVVYGSVFLIANTLTDGLYCLNNFRALRANVTCGNLVTVLGEAVLLPCALPFALAAAGVVRRWGSGRLDLYSLFLVLAFSTSSAATIRDGSADNYFLKPLAVACVIGGQELRRWIYGGAGRVEPAVLAVVVAVVFFLPQAGRACLHCGKLLVDLETRSERDELQFEFCRVTARQLDALGGPVLCQYDPVSLLCKHSVLMDTLTFAGLADQGVFDDTAIIAMIRDRQFAAIVLQFPLEAGRIPKYQSTDTVRQEWLEAMIQADYRCPQTEPLYIYQPPL